MHSDQLLYNMTDINQTISGYLISSAVALAVWNMANISVVNIF